MGHTVTSRDGTLIAYDRTGSGPAVILVGGGLTDRAENAPLAPELAQHGYTVFNYDRRGRGSSGNTLPYAPAREVEDLDALVAAAGGFAHVYGVSTGGALALEATLAGLPAGRLAIYEVPYDPGEETPLLHAEYAAELEKLLGQDQRGAAVELFMRVAGASEKSVVGARKSPAWPGLERIAHTLAYDAALLGDRTPPSGRLGRLTQPTLVATGALFEAAADVLATAIPNAERVVLKGQGHVVDPQTLAPVLARFFGAS